MGLGEKNEEKRRKGRGKEKREGERKGKREGERDLEVDLFRAPKHSIILLKSKNFLSSKFARASKTCQIHLFLSHGLGEKI